MRFTFRSRTTASIVLTVLLGVVTAPARAESPASAPAAPPLEAGCEDCFLDRDGTFQDGSAAYAALHDTGRPRRLQAALAVTSLIAAGSLWYWIDDRNIADWDEPSLKQRITGEAWRMDNNTFPMNFALHALSGSGYYAVSRASHLGVWESAGYAFLTSFFWEYVLEFKEKISINDVMVTPGAGVTIGEFFHKLAWYLNSPPRPTGAQRVLAGSLGPSVAISRAIDGRRLQPTSTSPLGYTTGLWHDFELGYSLTSVELDGRDRAVHAYEFRGSLVSIPGFLRPGKLRRWFYQADFSTLDLAVEHSTRGSGLRLVSDTALAGRLVQDMGYGAEPHGVAGVIGAYLAYRYTTSGATFDERLAVLHFPGPGFDLHARTRGIRAHLLGRAHFDFAGMGPLAYPQWKADHPVAREKSILRKQDYYFGWGASLHGAARLALGPLRASTEFYYGRFDSAEGLDRTQEEVTADVNATDSVTEHTTRLEIAPPRAPVSIGGFVATRRWESHVGSSRKRADVSSVGARIAVRF